jgi:hypothetical protein
LLLVKQKPGETCFDAKAEEEGESDLKTKFDKSMAVVEMLLHKKANINVVGVMGLCRQAKSAYLDNEQLKDQHFKRGKLPSMTNDFHPSYHIRKLRDVIDLMRYPTPHRNTKPKASTTGKTSSSTSIGRNFQSILLYKMIDPYWKSLRKLTSLEVDFTTLVGVLRAYDRYRAVFRFDGEEVLNNPMFIAMSDRVAMIAKNDTLVKIGKATV